MAKKGEYLQNERIFESGLRSRMDLTWSGHGADSGGHKKVEKDNEGTF